jgi:hypothetical protein
VGSQEEENVQGVLGSREPGGATPLRSTEGVGVGESRRGWGDEEWRHKEQVGGQDRVSHWKRVGWRALVRLQWQARNREKGRSW